MVWRAVARSEMNHQGGGVVFVSPPQTRQRKGLRDVSARGLSLASSAAKTRARYESYMALIPKDDVLHAPADTLPMFTCVFLAFVSSGAGLRFRILSETLQSSAKCQDNDCPPRAHNNVLAIRVERRGTPPRGKAIIALLVYHIVSPPGVLTSEYHVRMDYFLALPRQG